jgi:hypothetical protein
LWILFQEKNMGPFVFLTWVASLRIAPGAGNYLTRTYVSFCIRFDKESHLGFFYLLYTRGIFTWLSYMVIFTWYAPRFFFMIFDKSFGDLTPGAKVPMYIFWRCLADIFLLGSSKVFDKVVRDRIF